MPIAVRCPRCGYRYDLPDNLAGRTGQCTACQTTENIPKLRSAISTADGGNAAISFSPSFCSPVA